MESTSLDQAVNSLLSPAPEDTGGDNLSEAVDQITETEDDDQSPNGYLDCGVGRIPAADANEGAISLQKIKAYYKNDKVAPLSTVALSNKTSYIKSFECFLQVHFYQSLKIISDSMC